MYLRIFFFCLLPLSLCSQAAKEPKRLALVIGNALYQHSTPLQNPINDADSMEVALKQCGFDVLKYPNADRNSMDKAILDLDQKLAQKAYGTVLFYYSGHGMEIDGRNYLIPVDVAFKNKKEAQFWCKSVSSYTDVIKEYQIDSCIVLLDACRENPFQYDTKSWSTKGLTSNEKVSASSNFIGYAAGPGELAWDGANFGNGVYTKAILKHIRTPDKNIEEIFNEVAKTTNEWAREHNHNQIPYKTSAMLDGFYFVKKRKSFTSKGEFSELVGNMVLVAGGNFTMGCKEGRDYPCDLNENPAHEVTVDSFLIGESEVTVRQWIGIMGPLEGSTPDTCLSCPVGNISFDQIQRFIAVLNKKSGLRYRLPTEAEWEFAARGGVKSKNYRFAGSDNPHDVVSNIILPESSKGGLDQSSRGDSGNREVVPVMQSIPNELGIYDMSGNAWEFCQDWYQPDYYKESEKKNPTGPKKDTQYRTIRGSFWAFDKPADKCRVSTRSAIYQDMRVEKVGFRLARSIK
jgi:formylglycine-generating enzyme required for sulfatase activity